MPEQQGRCREVDELRGSFLALRAHLEAARLAPEEVAPPVRRRPGPDPQGPPSLFEPPRPDPVPAPASPPGGEGSPGRGRRPWLLAVPALTLAVGLLLGFALGSARAGGDHAGAAAARAAARPAPGRRTPAAVPPKVSLACMETATKGDRVIALLVANQRHRAAELLPTYTVASQQCRNKVFP
jgi:hypothetical protein